METSRRKKRRQVAALQDASAATERFRIRGSVLECGDLAPLLLRRLKMRVGVKEDILHGSMLWTNSNRPFFTVIMTAFFDASRCSLIVMTPVTA